MKSLSMIWAEGALYAVIAAGSSLVEFLVSDRPVTTRSIIAASVIAVVAAANSIKAFLSQALAGRQGNPSSPEIKS